MNPNNKRLKKVLLQESFSSIMTTSEILISKNRLAINRHSLTTTPDTPIADALALMSQTHSSCLVVLASDEHNGPLVGLFTEQDVVRLAANGVDWCNRTVAAVMSTPLITITEPEAQDSVAVITLLRQHQICHLPVVGDGGNFVGLITPTGILEAINPIEIDQTVEMLQQLLDKQTSQLRQLNQQLKDEIKKRDLLEEKIHSSEAKMRAVFGSMNDIVLVITPQDNQIKDVEILPTKLTSLAQVSTELISQTVDELFQKQTWLQKIQQALDSQKTINFDYSLGFQECEVRFSASITPLSSNSVVWVARDISDVYSELRLRKRAEEALRESQRWFQAITKANPNIMYVYDLIDKQNIYLNREIYTVIGYTPEEIQQMELDVLSTLLHPDDWTLIQAHFQQIEVAKEGEVFELEYRMRHKNGEWRWLLIRETVFTRNAEGKPTQILGTATDISDRKQVEAALKESEERWQLVLQGNNDGIWDLDLRTNKAFRSARYAEMLGYEPDEIGDDNEEWLRCIHPDDFERVMRVNQDYFERKIPHYAVEYRLRCKDGTYKWVLGRAQVVWDEAGNPIRMVGTTRDISDRKQAEETLRQSEVREREKAQELKLALSKLKRAQTQLIQTEKMSSLGQMVAGIAHEINNPTSFIYGNITPAIEYAQDLLHLVELYRQDCSKPSVEITEYLKEIDLDFIVDDFPKLLTSMQEGANRISEIVLSLRKFSRLDEAQYKQVNIHEGIDNTLLILQHRLRQQPNRQAIQVIKEYGELPVAKCYPGELNQVFMNLLSNAIDAFEESEELKTVAQPTIWIRTTLSSDASGSSQIAIAIADNGCGINADVLPRIFDPFFTTKPVGKGTGLGLSISYQIVVERHGGQLRCHSIPDQGAEFIVELPYTQTQIS